MRSLATRPWRILTTALTLLFSVAALACSDPAAPAGPRVTVPDAPASTILYPSGSPDVAIYQNQAVNTTCPEEWSACRDLTEDEFAFLHQQATNLMYSGVSACQEFALTAFSMLTAEPGTSKITVGYGGPAGQLAMTYTEFWNSPSGPVMGDQYIVVSNDNYIPNMTEWKSVLVHEAFHVQNDFWDGPTRGWDSVYEGYAYGAEQLCAPYM